MVEVNVTRIGGDATPRDTATVTFPDQSFRFQHDGPDVGKALISGVEMRDAVAGTYAVTISSPPLDAPRFEAVACAVRARPVLLVAPTSVLTNWKREAAQFTPELQVLEHFTSAVRDDAARPQIAQLTELGLVELTRKRQGQNIYELFGRACPSCGGLGHVAVLPGKDLLQPLATAAGLVLVSGAGNFQSLSKPVQLRIPEGIPCVIAAGGVDRNLKIPKFVSLGPVEWGSVKFYEDHPMPKGLIKPDVSAFPGPVSYTHLTLPTNREV